MNDLISRQMAIDAIKRNAYRHTYLEQIIDIVSELPPAQPEIIRCKDCKYASPNGKYGCKAYHFKLYETHGMEADDFCSRAERKEE